MIFDLYTHCGTCLGPNAGLVLTPRVAYPYCACLSQREKQQQVDALLWGRRQQLSHCIELSYGGLFCLNFLLSERQLQVVTFFQHSPFPIAYRMH